MAAISKADLLKLDVAARLELIEDLWESIANDEAAASQLPLSDGERAMLDERLREYHESPGSGRPWPARRPTVRRRA